MLLSELLKNEHLNAQLFAFFNTRLLGKENFKNTFCLRSLYRESKFLEPNEKEKIAFAKETNQNLSDYFKLPFENEQFGKHTVIIQNDLQFEIDDYVNQLYANILRRRQSGDEKAFEKALITAIFVPNGSADFNRQYYATDIYRPICTPNYFKKLFMLILNIDSRFLNLNFRELQKQFWSKENQRNTQIRINLAYFVENSESLNSFKTKILKDNQNKIKPLLENQKSTLPARADFYLSYILGKKHINIDQLRQRLNFDKDDDAQIAISRNPEIVRIARAVLDDQCAACHKDYAILDRTFLRRDGSPYLEIHHNVAFTHDKKQCDTLENLVKLCPVCHRALTKNRAQENYQKYLIGNILDFSQEAKNFAQIISQIDENNRHALIDFVYEALA